MKNTYGLPPDELDKIRERDQRCVYCGIELTDHGSKNPPSSWRTIEHFLNAPPWDGPTNVGLCCNSCNSSKGRKLLLDWFATPYCLIKKISETTVAEPVKIYLRSIR